MINQGDVFWAELPAPVGSGPGSRRPVVVVQNNLFNQSRIRTVVVCAVTSNVRLADGPGNVLLPKGHANLPKRSVVNISQIIAVDKSLLVRRIGTLSRKRLGEVLDGLALLLTPTESDVT